MKKLIMLVLMGALMGLSTLPVFAQGATPALSPCSNQFDQSIQQNSTGNSGAGAGTNVNTGGLAAEPTQDTSCLFDTTNNTTPNNNTTNNVNPTLAQDIDTHSGDVANNMDTDVSGNGNLVCNPGSQNGNSGNSVNAPADQQTAGPGGTARQGEFDPEGIEPTEGGNMTMDCPVTPRIPWRPAGR